MLVTTYWIKVPTSGRLGIMPRPRGGDWLDDEIRSLKMSGVDAVVSLLEDSEIAELDLGNEKSICENDTIEYFSFPIGDREVPTSHRETSIFVERLSDLLRNGMSVVIHCRQGVGRSALIAACVLVLNGFTIDQAFAAIAVARGCLVPDTEEQRTWVIKFGIRSIF